MKNKLAFRIASTAFIAIMLILTYLPIAILILFSFSNNKIVGDWSNFNFSFQLYSKLFASSKIMTAVRNTFIIAGVSSILSVVIGTFSAIGIYYLRPRLKSVLSTVNQITLVNSDIVTAVSLTLFFFIIAGNSLKGFPSLIIGHMVITLPYVILSVMPRLSQLNPNLYEAGLDLGAKPARTLFTVIIPQLIPAMISGFVLSFTLSLDDYVIAVYNKGTVETISTLIYGSSKKAIDPAYRALSTLLFILVLVVLMVINIASSRRAKRTGEKTSLPMMMG